MDDRIHTWVLRNRIERCADLIQELVPESLALMFIPAGGFLNILLSLFTNLYDDIQRRFRISANDVLPERPASPSAS